MLPPRDGDARRLRRARPLPLLRLLGGDAGPDVPHHRHLGRAAPRLRGHEVLPLHDGRLSAHAGRDPGRCYVLHGARRPASLHVRPAPRCCSSALGRAARSCWLFVAFALAFAIKVPMFPFHTWLPDAHVEAPTAGSVILAGVLLKLGDVRLPALRAAAVPRRGRTRCAPSSCALAVIGIIYGALVALVQPDMKKLVAYSSVSHLGFVMLGHLRASRPGRGGRRPPDGQPRPLDRRALPPGRHDLRAPPHAADRRLRRPREVDAGLRGVFLVVTLSLDRAARPERLRRRVPDPARRVPACSRWLAVVATHRRRPRRASTCCGCTSAWSSARSSTTENRRLAGPRRAARSAVLVPLLVLIVVDRRVPGAVPRRDRAGGRRAARARRARPQLAPRARCVGRRPARATEPRVTELARPSPGRPLLPGSWWSARGLRRACWSISRAQGRDRGGARCSIGARGWPRVASWSSLVLGAARAAASRDMRRRRQLRALLRRCHRPARRRLLVLAVDRLPRRAHGGRPGEYYALVLLRDRRHDADGRGGRPDRGLPRRSRSCRSSLYVLAGFVAEPARGRRGGAQVLPARRVRHRASCSTAWRSLYGATGATNLDRDRRRLGGAGGRARPAGR